MQDGNPGVGLSRRRTATIIAPGEEPLAPHSSLYGREEVKEDAPFVEFKAVPSRVKSILVGTSGTVASSVVAGPSNSDDVNEVPESVIASPRHDGAGRRRSYSVMNSYNGASIVHHDAGSSTALTQETLPMLNRSVTSGPAPLASATYTQGMYQAVNTAPSPTAQARLLAASQRASVQLQSSTPNAFVVNDTSVANVGGAVRRLALLPGLPPPHRVDQSVPGQEMYMSSATTPTHTHSNNNNSEGAVVRTMGQAELQQQQPSPRASHATRQSNTAATMTTNAASLGVTSSETTAAAGKAKANEAHRHSVPPVAQSNAAAQARRRAYSVNDARRNVNTTGAEQQQQQQQSSSSSSNRPSQEPKPQAVKAVFSSTMEEPPRMRQFNPFHTKHRRPRRQTSQGNWNAKEHGKIVAELEKLKPQRHGRMAAFENFYIGTQSGGTASSPSKGRRRTTNTNTTTTTTNTTTRSSNTVAETTALAPTQRSSSSVSSYSSPPSSPSSPLALSSSLYSISQLQSNSTNGGNGSSSNTNGQTETRPQQRHRLRLPILGTHRQTPSSASAATATRNAIMTAETITPPSSSSSRGCNVMQRLRRPRFSFGRSAHRKDSEGGTYGQAQDKSKASNVAEAAAAETTSSTSQRSARRYRRHEEEARKAEQQTSPLHAEDEDGDDYNDEEASATRRRDECGSDEGGSETNTAEAIAQASHALHTEVDSTDADALVDMNAKNGSYELINNVNESSHIGGSSLMEGRPEASYNFTSFMNDTSGMQTASTREATNMSGELSNAETSSSSQQRRVSTARGGTAAATTVAPLPLEVLHDKSVEDDDLVSPWQISEDGKEQQQQQQQQQQSLSVDAEQEAMPLDAQLYPQPPSSLSSSFSAQTPLPATASLSVPSPEVVVSSSSQGPSSSSVAYSSSLFLAPQSPLAVQQSTTVKQQQSSAFYSAPYIPYGYSAQYHTEMQNSAKADTSTSHAARRRSNHHSHYHQWRRRGSSGSSSSKSSSGSTSRSSRNSSSSSKSSSKSSSGGSAASSIVAASRTSSPVAPYFSSDFLSADEESATRTNAAHDTTTTTTMTSAVAAFIPSDSFTTSTTTRSHQPLTFAIPSIHPILPTLPRVASSPLQISASNYSFPIAGADSRAARSATAGPTRSESHHYYYNQQQQQVPFSSVMTPSAHRRATTTTTSNSNTMSLMTCNGDNSDVVQERTGQGGVDTVVSPTSLTRQRQVQQEQQQAETEKNAQAADRESSETAGYRWNMRVESPAQSGGGSSTEWSDDPFTHTERAPATRRRDGPMAGRVALRRPATTTAVATTRPRTTTTTTFTSIPSGSSSSLVATPMTARRPDNKYDDTVVDNGKTRSGSMGDGPGRSSYVSHVVRMLEAQAAQRAREENTYEY